MGVMARSGHGALSLLAEDEFRCDAVRGGTARLDAWCARRNLRGGRNRIRSRSEQRGPGEHCEFTRNSGKKAISINRHRMSPLPHPKIGKNHTLENNDIQVGSQLADDGQEELDTASEANCLTGEAEVTFLKCESALQRQI